MMTPHGPDMDAFEKASNVELKPVKLDSTLVCCGLGREVYSVLPPLSLDGWLRLTLFYWMISNKLKNQLSTVVYSNLRILFGVLSCWLHCYHRYSIEYLCCCLGIL